MRTRALITILILLALIAGASLWANKNAPPQIGGDRDAHGCLVAAGYAFDEQVGACIRAFEMTADIKAAVALAVSSVGRSYALTVVSFNSYEEPGAYDIMLEQGVERVPLTVVIKNRKVQSVEHEQGVNR